MRLRGLFLACLLTVNSAYGQNQPRPKKIDPPTPPDAKTLAAIEEKRRELEALIVELQAKKVPDYLIVDIAVYAKAAEYFVKHKEFLVTKSGEATLTALATGIGRAEQLKAGKSPWLDIRGGFVSRGYRSKIDDSIQPYAVSLPLDYGTIPGKKYRLDLVLHGRDGTLTEVKFLNNRNAMKTGKDSKDYIAIEVYGRGNNAYRWAGETDVFEALNAFLESEKAHGRGDRVDMSRLVLRGFSMGGAGSWHLGLHHPGTFAVIGPGAGFTETKGYAKTVSGPQPEWIDRCLHIYDAVDYAENAFNVPVVAYAGEKDPQIRAGQAIQERLAKMGNPATITFLNAPNLNHIMPPEWTAKAETEYRKYVGPNVVSRTPDHVRFVTWTLKYPTSYWVEILALDRHYERSLFDISRTRTGTTANTINVRAVRLTHPEGFPGKFSIDDQFIELPNPRQEPIILERKNDKWHLAVPDMVLGLGDSLRKRHNLQGPIDDAFMSGFVCIGPTGKGFHPAIDAAIASRLESFRKDWSKFLRGEVPMRTPDTLTHDDLMNKNWILFGDPKSNPLIEQCLSKLPMIWTAERLVLGETADPAKTFPVLIYPNPRNPKRYVVINSGHTFGEADFQGTNALLFPRLGDYALLDTSGKPIVAGLFDEQWQLPKGK